MSLLTRGPSGPAEPDDANQSSDDSASEPVQIFGRSDWNSGDIALISKVAAGDQASFELLYDRYAAVCLGLSRRIVVDPDLAQDAVKHAFLVVWKHADHFRRENGSVRSWLLNITHHQAVDLVRTQERHHRRQGAQEWLTSAIATGVLPEDQAETTWQSRRAMVAIGRLSKPQREVLMLCYYGGFTQTQVAKRLDVPLGTVKARCRTSLQLLRTALAAAPSEILA